MQEQDLDKSQVLARIGSQKSSEGTGFLATPSADPLMCKAPRIAMSNHSAMAFCLSRENLKKSSTRILVIWGH